MLQILYGTDWQGNADAIMARICECAAQRQEGQILIVPEQFSFDAEWRLAAHGDSMARYAEVLSFTRLCDRVCALVGGAAVQMLDRSGRLIAMAGAMEQLRSRLKRYGSLTAKPEFLLELLALYEEFRSYGVDSDGLRSAKRQLEGQLAEKLEELELIFEGYESVCANAAQDPATRLGRLAEQLHESEFARGRHIWIDGFSDFTGQELDVIAAMLATGAELTVSLCCDDPHAGAEVFSVSRDTIRQLRRLAPDAALVRLSPQRRQPAMAHLQAYLFDGRTPAFSAPDGACPVTLTCADTPYAQALSAVAGIRTLVMRGARWRDIAVACTDYETYRPLLERLFTQYRIPADFSGTRELLQTPVVRMVLSALRAASGRMEAEDVLDYLKSGASPIDREGCDRLENYALVWGLHGSLWRRAFTNDPQGFAQSREPAAYAEELAQLNALRERSVAPLLRLRDRLAAAKNTGGQILALSDFFSEIGLAERLSQQAQAQQAAGSFRLAQQTAQIYDSLIDTMEQIYGVLGNSVRTPEEFYQFFRAALSQKRIGTIPARLDCVQIGALQDLRNNRTAQLFVLGCTDGLLPAHSVQKGLLTQLERKRLKQAGLEVAPDAQQQLSRELLTDYIVLTSPAQGLHLCAAREEPSYLFTRMGKLFPMAAALPSTPSPVTVEQAAQCWHAGDPDGAARPDEPALAAALSQLRTRAQYTPGSLCARTVTGLYGRRLHLSASQADKLASCRWAYFLRYGLNARERRRAEIDPSIYGTFVHDVLEHVARAVMEEGGFHAVALERVHTLTAQAMEDFVQNRLAGFADLPERTRYLFRRSFDEVQAVARELWQELRQSSFYPVAFELPFSGQSAVQISGARGEALLSGFVDRVDRYDTPDGRSFIRVVDYKTGRKDFDYTDILSGMGLQMLIYLFALERRGNALFGAPVSGAGVLYMPAKLPLLSNTTKLSASEAEILRRESFRRKGLVLNDETVRLAMEPNDPPQYLPCKGGRSRNSFLADRAQFSALRTLVRQTLGSLTDEIFSGDTAPNPYRRGRFAPCDYCEFRESCHVAGGEVPSRVLAQTDETRFWQEVERRNRNDG